MAAPAGSMAALAGMPPSLEVAEAMWAAAAAAAAAAARCTVAATSRVRLGVLEVEAGWVIAAPATDEQRAAQRMAPQKRSTALREASSRPPGSSSTPPEACRTICESRQVREARGPTLLALPR